jgi:hypothetical protein
MVVYILPVRFLSGKVELGRNVVVGLSCGNPGIDMIQSFLEILYLSWTMYNIS